MLFMQMLGRHDNQLLQSCSNNTNSYPTVDPREPTNYCNTATPPTALSIRCDSVIYAFSFTAPIFL